MELTKARVPACVLVVFLVLVFNRANGVVVSIGDVTEIIQFGKEIALDIFHTWDLFVNDGPPNEDEGPNYYPFMKRNEKRVLKKLSALSDKIDAFEENVKIRNAVSFENMIRELHQQNQLLNHIWELNDQIARVSRRYRDFQEYSKAVEGYHQFTLQDFARACVSPNHGISERLERIHDLIIPEKHGFGHQNLLELLVNNLQVSLYKKNYT